MNGTDQAAKLATALQGYLKEHDSVQDTMYDAIMAGPEGGWRCGCDLCKVSRPLLAQYNECMSSPAESAVQDKAAFVLHGWEVQGILEDRLSVLLRPVNPQPVWASDLQLLDDDDGPTRYFISNDGTLRTPVLYGSREVESPYPVDDQIRWGQEDWVRCSNVRDATDEYETVPDPKGSFVVYRADDPQNKELRDAWIRASLMAKSDSRINFKITQVSYKRLLNVDGDEFELTGCPHGGRGSADSNGNTVGETRGNWLTRMWNGSYPSEVCVNRNPLVWVIHIKRIV